MSDWIVPLIVMFSFLAFCIGWVVFTNYGFYKCEECEYTRRHNLWKANAMLLIEAARKYRGPADSIEERGRDARKLDWFIANDKELMK